MNAFDNLQKNLFDTVTATMGYDATWLPSDGGQQQTARILFQGPTEKEKLLSADYNPEKLEMEYQKGDFAGLKEMADDNVFETVTIDTIGDFKVKSVSKNFDGKTYVARLKFV